MEEVKSTALCKDVIENRVENIIGYIEAELDDKTLEELRKILTKEMSKKYFKYNESFFCIYISKE